MMVDAPHFLYSLPRFLLSLRLEIGDCIDKNLGFEILVVYTCVPTLHTHTHTHTRQSAWHDTSRYKLVRLRQGHARLAVWCVCGPGARGRALLANRTSGEIPIGAPLAMRSKTVSDVSHRPRLRQGWPSLRQAARRRPPRAALTCSPGRRFAHIKIQVMWPPTYSCATAGHADHTLTP